MTAGLLLLLLPLLLAAGMDFFWWLLLFLMSEGRVLSGVGEEMKHKNRDKHKLTKHT